MRVRHLLSIALAAAMLAPATAGATTPPAPVNYGGPVMSSANWVEVLWGSLASQNPDLGPYIAKYLTDVSAASGTTGNVFSILAGDYQVPYSQSFAGSRTISPSVCPGTTTCSLTQAQINTELAKDIASGALPPPTGNGLQTGYLILFPYNVTITDEQGSKSDNLWCEEAGDFSDGSQHVIYGMVPDLGLTANCGALTGTDEVDDLVDVTQVQIDMLSDPEIDDWTANTPAAPLAWLDPNYGSLGSICFDYSTSASDYAAQVTINGDLWTVGDIWSKTAKKCEASTTLYSPPTVAFTDLPSGATVAFAALAQSTNGSIAGYSWNFGDGSGAGTGQSPTHTYSQSGTYTVKVTVTDADGFRGSSSQSVTVTVPPPPATPPSPSPSPSPSSTSTPVASPAAQGVLASTMTSAVAKLAAAAGPKTTATGSSILLATGEQAICPAGSETCTLTVTATIPGASKRAKPIVIGSSTQKVDADRTLPLTFKLNATGAALLRARGKLTVTLTLTLRYGATTVRASRTIKITAPRKR